MPTPYLLQDLTPEQRLRVLSLDYVTTSGMVAPEHWLHVAIALETYLQSGFIERREATIRQFPSAVDEEG